MERCVFIGYPQGYNGWKFYNPTTKKTVIAERADFDKRYFPLSKRPSSPSIAPPSPAVENTPAVTTPLPSSAPVENTPAATAPARPRTLPAAPKPASMPYYVPPHSDDSDSDDESLDHGGEIGPPALPAVEVLLLMNCGIGESLTSPTFECGGALPMCTYRRTRELALDHTWRSVYSLATLRDTRAGSSIIPPPGRQ
jgi:hypothetical protein